MVAEKKLKFSWMLEAALVTVGAVMSISYGQEKEEVKAFSGFSMQEVAMIKTFSPLPEMPPPNPTNKYADNPAAAALGQKFFFEKEWAGASLTTSSDALAVANPNPNGAGPKHISCFTCHGGATNADGAPKFPALDDGLPIGIGTGFHPHNSLPLVNSAYLKWTNWQPNFDQPWPLPIAVLEAPVIFNSTRLRAAHVVYDKYKTEYEAVFGAMPNLTDTATLADGSPRFPATGKPVPACANDVSAAGCLTSAEKATCTTATPDAKCSGFEKMSSADKDLVNTVVANVGKAIEAYMRKLVSRNAPFDKWVASDGKSTDLNAAQKRGLKLFVGKAGCTLCHVGPHFSDDKFHNTGLTHKGPTTHPNVRATDDGAFAGFGANGIKGRATAFSGIAAKTSDDTAAGAAKIAAFLDANGNFAGGASAPPDTLKGQFRTPGLRNVAQSAPYMHSGQLATLADVIEFYSRGGDSTGFSGTKDPLMLVVDLTAEEKADLVAFLESLTGEPVPSELVADTRSACQQGAGPCP
jgi:cytochrome c peroxidase